MDITLYKITKILTDRKATIHETCSDISPIPTSFSWTSRLLFGGLALLFPLSYRLLFIMLLTIRFLGFSAPLPSLYLLALHLRFSLELPLRHIHL